MGRRLVALGLLALASGTTMPAIAGSALSPTDIGKLFCTARVSGDMGPVTALLTPDLATLVAAVPPEGMRWQTQAADRCMPVGGKGTAEAPESVLYYTSSDGAHPGFSDRLVLHFVGEELMIDDIGFADGTTLRQQLAAR